MVVEYDKSGFPVMDYGFLISGPVSHNGRNLLSYFLNKVVNFKKSCVYYIDSSYVVEKNVDMLNKLLNIGNFLVGYDIIKELEQKQDHGRDDFQKIYAQKFLSKIKRFPRKYLLKDNVDYDSYKVVLNTCVKIYNRLISKSVSYAYLRNKETFKQVFDDFISFAIDCRQYKDIKHKNVNEFLSTYLRKNHFGKIFYLFIDSYNNFYGKNSKDYEKIQDSDKNIIVDVFLNSSFMIFLMLYKDIVSKKIFIPHKSGNSPLPKKQYDELYRERYAIFLQSCDSHFKKAITDSEMVVHTILADSKNKTSEVLSDDKDIHEVFYNYVRLLEDK